jgi:outer membrane immunogenic protein
MKRIVIVACATLLLAAGPVTVSPAHADDLEQVLKRLATLEREHATLEEENSTLRERVRRLEGRQNTEPANPRRVIMNAKIEGSPQRPQSPYPAVYKAAPATSTGPSNWTGPYVGAHVGWGRQAITVDDPFGPTNLAGAGFEFGIAPIRDFNSQGILGGMQAGWNYQIAHLVAGGEFSFSSADVNGDRSDTLTTTPSTFSTTTSLTQTRTWFDKMNWLATATARVGYAEDAWLMYTKGGLAVSRNSYTLTEAESSICARNCAPLNNTVELGADTRTGFIVGAGVEWAFWKGWSAVAEYNYMNFGTKHVLVFGTNPVGSFFPGPFFQSIPIEQSLQTLKLGLNYRFGRVPDAITANY